MNRLIDIDRLQKEFEMVCVGECDCCKEASCPVYNQPTVDAIPIPEGATNGNILMALFNVKILFVSKQFNVITVRYDNHSKTYDYDWWNAPYRKGEGK